MTIAVAASAPGKIVLCGEYAVLDGAPAIAMAIDRRAIATVTEIDGDVCRVRAPGYCDIEGSFKATAKGVAWSRGKREFALVEAVWRAAKMGWSCAKLIELKSGGFIDAKTRQKTGIGSSAATTIALCAALQQREDIAGIARKAHSNLQHGVGSGVDIACSNHGGLIEYRMANSGTSALQWPAGLQFKVLWTGVASSTPAKLNFLQNCVSKPSRGRLAVAAEEMATLWREGDAQSIVAHFRQYNKALHRFGVDHDLGIFNAGHAQLGSAAARCGLAYKPCGAGGGDVGIVLGTDMAMLETFVSEQAQRYTLLDCAMDRCGVRMETTMVSEA